MRYLVTGGAGFIGSHLVEALAARGHQVLILDDLSTGERANVEHVVSPGHVDVVEGSVVDADLVDDCMREADACFHLASAVGVQLVVSEPLGSLLTNVRGTDVVLAAAARHRRRLLYTSTSEIYGKSCDAAIGEETDRVVGSPLRARWGYSIAKAFGEAATHGYVRQAGADMVVARLFNTVGPRQKGVYGMVLPRFVRQALAGSDLTVFGHGTQSRCFVHVDDTVRALLLLMDAGEEATGEAFNVGSGEEIAIIELAARVIERAQSCSRVRLVPYEDAYADGFEELGRRRPDTTKLRRLTGWHPTRTVDETIDDVIAFERGRAADSAPAARVAG